MIINMEKKYYDIVRNMRFLDVFGQRHILDINKPLTLYSYDKELEILRHEFDLKILSIYGEHPKDLGVEHMPLPASLVVQIEYKFVPTNIHPLCVGEPLLY